MRLSDYLERFSDDELVIFAKRQSFPLHSLCDKCKERDRQLVEMKSIYKHPYISRMRLICNAPSTRLLSAEAHANENAPRLLFAHNRRVHREHIRRLCASYCQTDGDLLPEVSWQYNEDDFSYSAEWQRLNSEMMATFAAKSKPLPPRPVKGTIEHRRRMLRIYGDWNYGYPPKEHKETPHDETRPNPSRN